MDDDLKSLFEGLDREGFYKQLAKAYGREGWTYRDIPWTLTEIFDSFVNKLGCDIVVIISSTMLEDNKKWKRGQCLISPSGMELLRSGSFTLN